MSWMASAMDGGDGGWAGWQSIAASGGGRGRKEEEQKRREERSDGVKSKPILLFLPVCVGTAFANIQHVTGEYST